MAKVKLYVDVKLKWWAKPIIIACVMFNAEVPKFVFSVTTRVERA